MAKKAKTATPTIAHDLTPQRTDCPHCGGKLRADYANRRTLHALAGVARLHLTVRRCHTPNCSAFKRPYRPEAEGRLALPHHEFGLDVVALVGRLRYLEHRSVPGIRNRLVERDVSVSERTVANLIDRYDELPATSLGDDARLRRLLNSASSISCGKRPGRSTKPIGMQRRN